MPLQGTSEKCVVELFWPKFLIGNFLSLFNREQRYIGMAFCSKIITGWTAPVICLSLAFEAYSEMVILVESPRKVPNFTSSRLYLPLASRSFRYILVPQVCSSKRSTILHIYSHLANQRMDGIFGGIIISEPDSPPGIPLVMFDWFQTNSLDLVTSNPFDQGIGKVLGIKWW